ncbi:DUF5666 domain-containing protein [Cellulomonas sp. PS-H5]|uniref:DUF5666 domain-containing protein n=1 Tax=Cellulomonas sp. PS-H5 TaxID=2820400 RepID=UPI001C501AB9|nr:DUF5666 domain-containing protein [Cellulomonas sp. PS-H5]MBW0254746.1 hypothetical protein [Cellulomonas sp. PS-H5]
MSRTRTGLLAAPAAVAVLVLLAACSGDTTDAGTASSGTGTAEAQDPGDRSGEMPGGGGTSGEIAAVSDALLQVQGDDGQTAVAWDGTTTITQTVTADLSDVTVGSCVVAFTSGDDDAAATSVAITAATDGECTGGFGGGSGGGGMPADGEMPSGMPTDGAEGRELPGGAPTDMPSGAPDGASGGSGGFGGVTSGLVTAVDGSTITVEPTGMPGSDDATTTTATITVDAATTFTSTVAADATAIAVGRCVTAQGEADSSGQVAATSLTLSDATDAGCSTGFGGRGGPGGAGGPGGSGSEGEGSDA